MSKNDAWSQNVPYPVLSDPADIEVATQGIVNGIVPLCVMRFSDANARAATLTGDTKPVPGMVTYLIAEDRWEGYQADGTWLLLSDGTWSPLTFSSGYGSQGGSPGYRKKAGGGVELRGRILALSGKLNDGGDAVQAASFPSVLAPEASRFFIVPTQRATISGVTRMTARIEITPSGQVLYMCESGGGQGSISAPAWFSLDGIQFSPAGN